MSFSATILTLYPEMFPGHLAISLAGRARERGLWSLKTVQIRDFATDRHRSVDDTPSGGGAGMVMRADILARAIDSVPPGNARYILSPRGRQFDQNMARQMASQRHIVFICGRFEGVDERIIETRNLQELSIGDYILSGGEAAVLIVLDAVIRLLPGVMGNDLSETEESFETGLLEYPHYTRPQIFEGRAIPDILTSGNHAAIATWRKEQAKRLTRERRPDLWQKYRECQMKINKI